MQVLSDVSFQASRGECVVLCGKSGCGKTTMLRLVNGLIPHFYAGKLEGNVLVGGQEMQQTPLSQTSRIVGSVFQNPRTQFFHLDTTGEMAFNLENQNVPRPQMKKRLEEVSYRLNLQELMDRNIFERQRRESADRLWLRLCGFTVGSSVWMSLLLIWIWRASENCRS